MKYYIISDKNIIECLFGGISLLDIQNFLLQKNIDKEQIFVYQDIPYNENTDDYASLFNIKFKHAVKKKKIADTDVLIYSNEENIEYYDEIFRIILHGGTINEMNDIELFCCSHDYDWLVVCLFKDKMLFYNFLDYLSKKNICIRVSSVEEWQ